MNRSLWQIFAIPILVALASGIGLVTALVGDGVWDVLSWVGLGLPVALSVWHGLYRRRRAPPH